VRQLADYQAHIDQFKEENVDIIALSVDPLDKAKEMAERVKATFSIGYGLEVPRDADKVGRLLGRTAKDHSCD
jgi:alkyl hydroperoxide reductase subunit AhpC